MSKGTTPPSHASATAPSRTPLRGTTRCLSLRTHRTSRCTSKGSGGVSCQVHVRLLPAGPRGRGTHLLFLLTVVPPLGFIRYLSHNVKCHYYCEESDTNILQ